MTVYESKGENLSMPWWLALLMGLVAVVLGFFLLQAPAASSALFSMAVGAFMVLAGIALLLSLIVNRRRWGYKLVGGLAGIGAGFLIVDNPLISAKLVPTTVNLLLGIQGVIIGLILLVMGFEDRSWGQVVLGFVAVAVGIVLLFNRWLLGMPVPTMLGVVCIGGGIAAMILAFRCR
jgi:uncharacterized membrane protein HdeD (DUF308 family)